MRHFLKESDFTPKEIGGVFARAREFKLGRGKKGPQPLSGQTWALVFEKSSMRTRVSLEVGIRELGGNSVFLNNNDIQFGQREPIEDMAKVMSRYLHGFAIRTYSHEYVERFAAAGNWPVINALSDFLHPCQIYSDAFTAAEKWAGGKGDLLAALKGRKIAFLGDTSFNIANSWILGASLFGMRLSLAGPKKYAPGPQIRALLKAEGRAETFEFTTDPYQAVEGADLVYTDVWASMGHEKEEALRARVMHPYAVTAKLFAAAKPDALFMHCLPAHPGDEVEQAVLDNPRCVIFDEAENRLHVQKAIIAALAESARNSRP